MSKNPFRRPPRINVRVRAEDPSRIWERRAPLTPDAVYALTSSGRANVVVVPSARRVFKDEEYRKAGAILEPHLKSASIILGIKEPPIAEVGGGKSHQSTTHFMFSHTAKGQPYNTPLLAKFVNPPSTGPRLVDFELLTDGEGKRTVGFGWYAGVAGVLESLSSMAHSHLEIGVASPFLYTPRPHTLPSLAKLREALREIGTAIATHGTPPELGPFIFGLTGTGKVAQGCLAMLAELPIEHIKVEDLPSVVKRRGDALKKIYLVHAKPEDYFVRVDGGKYDRTHYYQSPQSYTSVFAQKVAPYLTLLLNGTGWSPSFPRLMTNDQLTAALLRAADIGGARFTNIGDISCDVEGGLEFMTKATTISSPFYKVRPPTLPTSLPPVQIMSVDILPATIPLDASRSFSDALMPYLCDAIDWETEYARLGAAPRPYPVALERATIAKDGDLTEKHTWLGPAVQKHHLQVAEVASAAATQTSAGDGTDKADAGAAGVQIPPEDSARPPEVHHTPKKKILLLGSGMVAQPAVDMLAGRSDIELVIGSNSLVEMQALVGPHLHVKYRIVDIEDPKSYMHLISDSDVVISLLPAGMHPFIAKACIRYKTHLVTASYISPEMRKLNGPAYEAGVLLLNEIGLDPGIDHCSAMELLARIRREKKSVLSFTSFCGGLPAPEDSHVPLRYKFSWRPLGVLTAALNYAKYLLDKKEVYVPSAKLLSSYFPKLPISREFELEGLPNRDSLSYIKSYKLDTMPSLSTFVRGTLRYPGFSTLMGSFKKVGFLNDSNKMHLTSWETFFPQCLSLLVDSSSSLPSLSSLISIEELGPLQDALEWLGLVNPPVLIDSLQTPMPPLPDGALTPLQIFAYLLGSRLKYAQHERDMVVLSHEIITTHPATRRRERTTSTLVAYATTTADVGFRGERPASAMARTVGIPVALAALLVAEGRISGAGVQSPLAADIYVPVLQGLAEVGLHMEEKTRTVSEWAPTVESTLMNAESLRESAGKAPKVDPDAHDLDQDPHWIQQDKLA